MMLLLTICSKRGLGPWVVVRTAAFHARVQGSFPGFGGFEDRRNNNASSPSTRKT